MRSLAGVVALLFGAGCGEAVCGSETDASAPDEVVIHSGTRIVVGCRESVLELGEVVAVETAAVSVVWIDQVFTANDGTFAVGWLTPEGYQVRLTNGWSTSNTLVLPGMDADAAPQLFWNGSDLELYYSLQDAVYVDTISMPPSFEINETRFVGMAPGFRAVATEPGQVAVLGRARLLLGGAQVEASLSSVGTVGWNGDHFLFSTALGHGDWTLSAIDPDGAPNLDALELTWSGIDGTGRGAGSDFASRGDTGKHAVAIASSGRLTFVLEGEPGFEAELLEPDADVATFWDGERYVVLLATGEVNADSANRDIGMLAFGRDGALLAETPTLTLISESASDERFPVGASSGSGDYGIVWIRDHELVMQRCRLTER